MATKVGPVKFKLDRDTKGAWVYKELKADGSPVSNPTEGVIGGLYIRKDKLPARCETISVMIEAS